MQHEDRAVWYGKGARLDWPYRLPRLMQTGRISIGALYRVSIYSGSCHVVLVPISQQRNKALPVPAIMPEAGNES